MECRGPYNKTREQAAGPESGECAALLQTDNKEELSMNQNKPLPKIALGAWAWGNDGTFGGQLTAADLRPVFDAARAAALELSAEEIAEMEALGSAAGLNVIRYWEKEMK